MNEPLIFTNGRIWTADPARPWASTVVVDRGRIAAVDPDPVPVGRRVDLGGRVVTPGLIDSHVHLVMAAVGRRDLDLRDVDSRSAFEAAIEQRHRELPDDAWLIAHGWSDENWGGQRPDKSWLRAAGDRPTVCYRMDIHVALVNDAVLERCATLDDPPGGVVVRQDGEPTGLMIEAAAWTLVNPLLPRPDAADQVAALREAMPHLHARGVTGVGSMEYAKVVESVLQPDRATRPLRVGITLLDRTAPLDLAYARSFANDDQMSIVGCKAFLDGTLGSRTARMLAPYADDPANCGQWVELAASGGLEEWIRTVAEAGLSPSMHAIGDAAARLALDVAEPWKDTVPVRIEHAQQIDPADIERFVGVIASMQPQHKADDGRTILARLGPARLAGSFAFRSLREAGAILAFGSDWPVVDCDPIAGIRTATTGRIDDGTICLPEQNLTVEQALTAYTRDAARSLGWDDGGVVRSGARADFAVFDVDPFAANWREAPPAIALTVARGVIVHETTGLTVETTG